MGLILLKHFELFQADREELNRELKRLGLPELSGWKVSRALMHAIRDIDKHETEFGQLVAKKIKDDDGEVVYRIGIMYEDFFKILDVVLSGESIREVWYVDETDENLRKLKRAVERRYRNKLNYYLNYVHSREISEYVSTKVVPHFRGYPITNNAYVVKDAPALHRFASLINSISRTPALFLLKYGEEERDNIAEKLRAKVQQLARREKPKFSELDTLLKTLLFLQEEGFDFSREIALVQQLMLNAKRKRAPRIAGILKE